MPTALITGIDGQDGSYLAELLLSRGYRVVGTVCPDDPAGADPARRPPAAADVVALDLRDQGGMTALIAESRPDEIYNLAARASSAGLFREPVELSEVNGLAITRLLEAIRAVDPRIRFFQASSSEVFGNPAESPQTEDTPFRPRNPYGAAKAYAHWIVVNYRETYGLYACSGILYNHESPRRGMEFVTRKISHAAASIRLGSAAGLTLGNIEARRDWGFAGDYVEGMWRMMQQPSPGDFILASGAAHSVREFCDLAFSHVGLDYRDFVEEDRAAARPPETVLLVGNPDRARRLLGWEAKVSFPELVRMMVDADLQRLGAGPERRGNSPTPRRPIP